MELHGSKGYSLAAAIMLFFAGMLILTATAAFIALLVVSHQWIKSGFESQTWDTAILPVGYLLAMGAGQVMGHLSDYMRGEMRGISGVMVARKIVFESLNGLFFMQTVFFCILAVMCKTLDVHISVSLTLVIFAAICIIPVWVITKRFVPAQLNKGSN